jgi:hypothetical protein
VGLVIGVAVVIALLVALRMFVSRSGYRHEPGVESFRRHIDALSPEARREVQDRVRGNHVRRGDSRHLDSGASHPDDEQEFR